MFGIRPGMQAAALMIATAFILVGAPAKATMTQVFGGPGGSPYTLVCANGSFLVGFYAKAGGWVDSVGLLCAPYDPASRQMQHNFVHGAPLPAAPADLRKRLIVFSVKP